MLSDSPPTPFRYVEYAQNGKRRSLPPLGLDLNDDVPDLDDPRRWIEGDDPEAEVRRTADRRSLIRRKALNAGAQFVAGLAVLFIAVGLIALAATYPTPLTILPALVLSPLGGWYFSVRWKRWLGTAPYVYRLLTSLGEDAENVLDDHRNRTRQKYIRRVGDLHRHTRPGD